MKINILFKNLNFLIRSSIIERPLLLISFIIILLVSCKEETINQDLEIYLSDLNQNNKEGLYLNVNLGQAGGISGTRDYSYDPGSDTYSKFENHIENGRIYIYEEAANKKEGDARCVSYGSLIDPIDPTLNTGNNEFSTQKILFRNIELSEFDFDETKNYYALVILNANSSFSYPQLYSKFSEWAQQAQENRMLIDDNVDVKDIGKTPDFGAPNSYKYITMTNATGQVNSEIVDGIYSPHTLQKIDSEDIQRGKFDEEHQSKTTIYVQRNVAKVLVKTEGSDLDIEKKIFTVGDFTLQANISVFSLNVTNKFSYPVMNIDDLDWTRSFSHSSSSDEFNRVFWAKDPNYNIQKLTTKDFGSSSLPIQAGKGFPLYCLENTMDWDCMLQGQTTRVIVRCEITWWGKTTDENRNSTDLKIPDNYIKSETNQNPTSRSEYNNDFDTNGYFKIGNGENANMWDWLHINETFSATYKEKYPESNVSFILNNKVNGVYVLGGYYKLKDLIGASQDINDNDWLLLAQSIGLSGPEEKFAYYAPMDLGVSNKDNKQIYELQSCFMYYVVRIRHFADSDGTSEESVEWDGSTIRKTDGTKIANYTPKHLGRWGVVRNNFYEITINAINHIGVPDKPPHLEDDDTDDMPEDYYINVTINIKDWGKRENSFIF
ncbi:MAG: Mfa1 fimbrilin C-terminal domain-containing protein [Muribaculaceae bacterium]|nr:Mfa1 fimbrilin C-terminal domain-containing protein [Muribaculaceae bacterium]